MAEILLAIVTTIGWIGTLVIWLLLRAQGVAASLMLTRYMRWSLLAWSVLIVIQTLYYLDLDLQALEDRRPWLSLIAYDFTGQIAFRGLLALAIWNFIRDILQPQKISATPVPEAQIQIDPQGVVVSWDLEATKLFGWHASETVGQLLADKIIPPAYREAHTQGLAHYRETTDAPILDKRLTFPALTKTNGQIIIEFRVKENLTSAGTIFTASCSPAVVIK